MQRFATRCGVVSLLWLVACQVQPAVVRPGQEKVGSGKPGGGAAECTPTSPCDDQGKPLPKLSLPDSKPPVTGDIDSVVNSKYRPEADARGISLQKPAEESALNGYLRLAHTKSVKVDMGMTLEEGRRFYFEGLLPQALSKSDFVAAVNKGVVPRYGWAQCAVTTASVLEHAALRALLPAVASRFNKQRRESSKDLLSCTDEVEVELKRLGWSYYFKTDFVAPTGAIALEKGRYNKCGTVDHSGHIYTIMKDNGIAEPDVIADNGGYNHVYMAPTGGFWLPPGVYPAKR
jgi:hypothetical protein